MLSHNQEIQRKKERKVFNPFSSFLGIGNIKQIEGTENSYPDGVLMLEGQEIAVEQTDYYYHKTKNASSYLRFQSLLSNIAKQLTERGYKGCLGIRLNDKAKTISMRELSLRLIGSIQQYINSPDTFVISPMIDKIHFCPKPYATLVIKDYQCEFPSSGLCRNLSLEEVISERVREKEGKLGNCKKDYSQHWLIISIPFEEYVNVDTSEYNPVKTLFDKIFIQRDERGFEEIKTEKIQIKQS